mmetsp:Transcript_33781/g.43513  ORF Transcript_33781/g.43513 Transcript_33781/m.43513 type:complete len:100 (-) Transcript_33781:31-330(-)
MNEKHSLNRNSKPFKTIFVMQMPKTERKNKKKKETSWTNYLRQRKNGNNAHSVVISATTCSKSACAVTDNDLRDAFKMPIRFDKLTPVIGTQATSFCAN